MMTNQRKKCIECDEPFHGRSDKRFCSDQCRTANYNDKNKEVTNYIRNVNAIVRKNRKVLAQLNPEGKIRLKREKLATAGFNFKFFTNVYRTQKGDIYYFCYDQGYRKLDNDFFMLVVRKENI